MTTFETFSSEPRASGAKAVLRVLTGVCAAAAMRYRVWSNRRQVARLLGWDDHMLRDIGLTQGDVYSAMAVGPDEDSSIHLSMLSLERRFAQKAQLRERLSQAAELRATARQRIRI